MNGGLCKVDSLAFFQPESSILSPCLYGSYSSELGGKCIGEEKWKNNGGEDTALDEDTNSSEEDIRRSSLRISTDLCLPPDCVQSQPSFQRGSVHCVIPVWSAMNGSSELSSFFVSVPGTHGGDILICREWKGD